MFTLREMTLTSIEKEVTEDRDSKLFGSMDSLKSRQRIVDRAKVPPCKSLGPSLQMESVKASSIRVIRGFEVEI
jgi:hypothetical protein